MIASVVRTSSIACGLALMLVAACDKKETADVPCDTVVAKLMSYQKAPDAADKKMFGKMCEGMDKSRRACVASSSSLADVQAKCGG